uniref:CKLF like MARVEL transmembrane domain containing 3 n=1 Tax=Ficedula albicollis TaxID=59894 RepID=A0A803V3Q0_FICAL
MKISRTLVALGSLICFIASGSHEAYVTVAGMETGITVLFLLVYLLRLDVRVRCFYWPLTDVLNSVIAALFLLLMSLFGLRIETNKGTLAGVVLSFIIFICYIASLAASFMMAPLLEFLLALFLFFAYASKLNEKFKGVHWPLADFLRCVTAAIIYFAISIAAVSKYSDGASIAAGVFGFAATIVFAFDFYITFNYLVTSLQRGSSDSPEGHKTQDEDYDSDSD